MTVDVAALRPESVADADARAQELLAEGRTEEAVATLSHAVEAFTASVGSVDPQATTELVHLARVALSAQAVEVAMTAATEALSGMEGRGEADTPAAGGVHATLAMAAAACDSPAAYGEAERAHRLTADVVGDDDDRRRALAAWRSLGQPRRVPVTGKLSIVAFGAPRSIVFELEQVASDGAPERHVHGLAPEEARALRQDVAETPFAWRSAAGGFGVVSRTGGAAVRFTPDVELALNGRGVDALRAALADALAAGAERKPGRNDPCPCGSGRKYKRCCAA